MTILEITASLSEDQLKDLWCDLNCFRWPRELWPERERPSWWVNSKYSEQKQGFIEPFMDHIEQVVGMESILVRWRDQLPKHELPSTIT